VADGPASGEQEGDAFLLEALEEGMGEVRKHDGC
jgi:hypothetical protein